MNDLLTDSTPTTLPVSITPTSSFVPPNLLILAVGEKRTAIRIAVLENGELDIIPNDPFYQRVAELMAGASVGVGIELLIRHQYSE
jgi:hypothetical protein